MSDFIQSNDSEYRNTNTSHYPDAGQGELADITNADRSAWAEVAVEAFIAQTGRDGVEDDAISDLIADIGHLCDANDIDYLATIRRAIGHWHAEQHPGTLDVMPDVRISINGGVS